MLAALGEVRRFLDQETGSRPVGGMKALVKHSQTFFGFVKSLRSGELSATGRFGF
jgi:hypothetical protein